MILVTGATGTVGGQVVAQLLARGEHVRAATREPATADVPAGVDAVAVDLSDPDTLEQAMDGVDAVFLIWPFMSADTARDLAPRVIDVIARHGARIVYVSSESAGGDPESFWARVEQAVQASGSGWTILRPTGFASNTAMWAGQVRAGDSVRFPFGEAARSLIHEADIAAVAVKALSEDGHAGRTYVLSGPAIITQADQVRAIGAAVGRPLRWDEQPRDEALTELIEQFGDEDFATTSMGVWASFIDHPERVTATVEELTGTRARPYAEWARDHAGDFR